MNKLELIKETTDYVYKNSKHVSINEEKIKELTRTHNFNIAPHWLSNNPFNILDLEIEQIVNFLIIYDSIDYSFWGNPKWTIQTNEEKLDGAFALMYSLLKLMKEKGHLNFEKITIEEFKEALKGNVEIPLLEQRYKTIQENSKIINKKMNGNFYTFTKNITLDTELFKLITTELPSFEDTRTYKGKTIYFYKLAQLATSDILHIRQIKEQIETDTSHLLGCADYKIPQVLRGLGILEYSEYLEKIIDNKQEIEENSEYEIEIRANMIKSLELIKQSLNKNINLIDINDIIWSLGQDKTSKLKPYHLTRTRSY